MTVELWPIGDVKPYAGNAKLHPPEQVAALVKSIDTFGWTQPIVIDAGGVVIAGHGRRLAALARGDAKVPVVVRRDLTPAEANALRLADNRTASQLYDTALLQAELAALDTDGFDLSALGFDGKELEFLTADLGALDEGVFVDDVGGAVETQKTANDAKVREVDGEAAVGIGEAFGFKRVTPGQARRLKAFVARLEGETGARGIDAVMAFLDELGVAP
ncbi:hypothetical protein [Azospirillum argentinense]